MIVDLLKNRQNYPFGNAWDLSFQFIQSLNPDAEEKEYPILNKDLFARLMSYETKHPETAILEAHRKYADIHVILNGCEKIEWFPVESLKVKDLYNQEKDAEFFHRPADTHASITLSPGMFAVFFPSDGHMSQLVIGETLKTVKKAVIKIDISLL